MANHAFVTTKRHMTPEKVRAVLDRLNQEIFFGCLEIEDTMYSDDEPGWFIHVKGESEYQVRQCWLNNRQSFEIRHGGGSDFLWWVDQRIQDEISKVFDGRVKDESGSGYDEVLTSWGMPDSYPEYINKRVESYKQWEREYGNNPLEKIIATCACKMRFMLWGYPKSYRDPYKTAQRRQKT